MKKRIAAFSLSAVFLFLLSACTVNLPVIGEIKIGSDPEYVDMPGEWIQTNSHNDGSYQGIFISEDYIEVYWVFDKQNGATLYWAGTFEYPNKVKTTGKFTFESVADTSRMMHSLLASEDETKTFTYDHGIISYTVNYNDMEMSVVSQKGAWGMESLRYRGIIDIFDVVEVVYQNAWGDSTFAEYHIGDTWTIPGEWSMTLTGAAETGLRNPYFDRQPATVYAVEYTYENLGWDDDNDGGLQFALGDGDNVLDCIGEIGYGYPLGTQRSPRQIGVGETCEAQDFVAVNNSGTFRLTVTKRDSDGVLHGAIFIVDI